MEEKDKENKENIDDIFMKCVKKLTGVNEIPIIPQYPINKKIQKKLLKEKEKEKENSFEENIEKSEYNSSASSSEEEEKEITKKIVYPSGIIKITKKNGKNKLIKEITSYKDLKQIYIDNIKNNVDKELIKLIESTFLLYNRRPIIKNLVQKPFSTKKLEEKILLWKYYIEKLSKEEKAFLIKKLLYYIGKFSEKILQEFINYKEISQAYFIFLSKGRIKKDNSDFYHVFNNFYMMNSLFGYDGDGKPLQEKNKSKLNTDEIKAGFLLQNKILNIKNELNGTGYGFIFLKELKEICDMYTNSSYLFKSIFNECFNIFENDNEIIKIEIVRILWNYFGKYFIEDSFIINFLFQLKSIFAIYKQDLMVEFIHKFLLYRFNAFNSLNNINEYINDLIGTSEEILDEKEKVDKMNNIDDVLKYIEGNDNENIKPKKKKKKKNKNSKNNNDINNIINYDNVCNNNENDIDVDIDIDDSVSIISEADSVLDSFKNDIMEETVFNTGNKIIPQLSSEFLNHFK